jgi:predicted phosphohydrolase
MPKLKYLVSGNHDGFSEHLGRVTVAAALRTARQLVQEGYIDVRICTPRGQVLSSDDFSHLEKQKGDRHGQRPVTRQPRTKKPKKEKIKVIAAAPSQKAAAWQPSFMPGRKK